MVGRCNCSPKPRQPGPPSSRLDHRAHHRARTPAIRHQHRDRQRVPQPVRNRLLPPRPAATRRRQRKPVCALRPAALSRRRDPTRPRRRAADIRPSRPRPLVARLPAADPARRRAPRPPHRPCRGAHDPTRADLRADRRTNPHPRAAPASSARALVLRRPLRQLDTRTQHRRPDRRTNPHRAAALTQRANSHADPRPLPPQPPHPPHRPGTRGARHHQPRHTTRTLTGGRPSELWIATPPPVT